MTTVREAGAFTVESFSPYRALYVYENRELGRIPVLKAHMNAD